MFVAIGCVIVYSVSVGMFQSAGIGILSPFLGLAPAALALSVLWRIEFGSFRFWR
jgi:hypothetical protein